MNLFPYHMSGRPRTFKLYFYWLPKIAFIHAFYLMVYTATITATIVVVLRLLGVL